jgi:hypothetical protein
VFAASVQEFGFEPNKHKLTNAVDAARTVATGLSHLAFLGFFLAIVIDFTVLNPPLTQKPSHMNDAVQIHVHRN